MQTDTIMTTLVGIQEFASGLDVVGVLAKGPMLAEKLQAAADKFNAAITAGEKTTGSASVRDVEAVYANLANILIGKRQAMMLVTPSIQLIKDAHSNMAAALETLVPDSTTRMAEDRHSRLQRTAVTATPGATAGTCVSHPRARVTLSATSGGASPQKQSLASISRTPGLHAHEARCAVR
jgi:hypothetical protein